MFVHFISFHSLVPSLVVRAYTRALHGAIPSEVNPESDVECTPWHFHSGLVHP